MSVAFHSTILFHPGPVGAFVRITKWRPPPYPWSEAAPQWRDFIPTTLTSQHRDPGSHLCQEPGGGGVEPTGTSTNKT